MHLGPQKAAGIVCARTQRGSTHCSCVTFHIDEQSDRYVVFIATLPRRLPFSTAMLDLWKAARVERKAVDVIEKVICERKEGKAFI